MVSPQLDSAERTHLGLGDPGAVVAALGNSPISNAISDWLIPGNRYRGSGIDTVRSELDAGSHDSAHLAEYLAGSSIIHCGDAWSYVGRALEAGTRGDPNAAIHLAYYASLRAALSLLATEGVGVLNGRTFVVETSGACSLVPKPTLPKQRRGTHVMTWLAIQDWANQPRSLAVLGEIVRPFGERLTRWLAALPSPPVTRLASAILLNWGADLQRVASDQVLRNAASYDPSSINGDVPLGTRDAGEFVSTWWRLFEPSAPSPFDNLDRHLLRLFLEQALAQSPVSDSELVKIINGAGMSSRLASTKPFLARTTSSLDPTLLTQARRPPTVGDPAPHFPVIARASLLARIASGSVAMLLNSAGLSRADIEFWWVERLRQRGIWDLSPILDPATDLWPDVDDAIQSIDSWLATPRSDGTFHSMIDALAGDLWVIGGGERVSAWSLDL